MFIVNPLTVRFCTHVYAKVPSLLFIALICIERRRRKECFWVVYSLLVTFWVLFLCSIWKQGWNPTAAGFYFWASLLFASCPGRMKIDLVTFRCLCWWFVVPVTWSIICSSRRDFFKFSGQGDAYDHLSRRQPCSCDHMTKWKLTARVAEVCLGEKEPDVISFFPLIVLIILFLSFLH